VIEERFWDDNEYEARGKNRIAVHGDLGGLLLRSAEWGTLPSDIRFGQEVETDRFRIAG
jgi:hypothetical protein